MYIKKKKLVLDLLIFINILFILILNINSLLTKNWIINIINNNEIINIKSNKNNEKIKLNSKNSIL